MSKTKNEEVNEATLKGIIYDEYFKRADECILDKYEIDLWLKYKNKNVLWAEAKPKPHTIETMLAQLIFTIKRIHNDYFNPKYLCVFDNEKMAFILYSAIAPIFNDLDFNWKVRSSDTTTKEFKKISERIKASIERKNVLIEQENIYDFKELVFYYKKNKNELREWINNNIFIDELEGPLKIDDTNFQKVYNFWLDEVKKTINTDWNALKDRWKILDCDFYLADLFSYEDNNTIEKKLFVLLQNDIYVAQRKALGLQNVFDFTLKVEFNDNQVAHRQFWNKYVLPPEDKFWDLILKRKDLLVPIDIRERLGAFFTPLQWVKLSQQYMTDTWGNLDDYYIWDCAGGT